MAALLRGSRSLLGKWCHHVSSVQGMLGTFLLVTATFSDIGNAVLLNDCTVEKKKICAKLTHTLFKNDLVPV